MKTYSTSAIYDRMQQVVEYYNSNFKTLSELEISDLRAELSGIHFLAVGSCLLKAYKDHQDADNAYDRIKATVIDELLQELKTISRVELVYTKDERFLTASKDRQEMRDKVDWTKRIIASLDHTLNSMSDKIRLSIKTQV